MSEKDLLRVLTIFDVPEEAEQLINVLRNSGQIVRDVRAEDEEDLEKALEDNPVDIILAKQTTPFLNVQQALEILNKHGRDIPLVVIYNTSDEGEVHKDLAAGARDAVEYHDTARLFHVIKREISDLKVRKAMRRNEQMLHEAEKRSRALIDTSRDAIAYVLDGMHIYANQAYLEIFGYESLDDVEGTPILDMVSTDDHAKLKTFLRNYAKGKSSENTIDVQAKHTQGHSFKVSMEFSQASMEGEVCSQIIIRDQSDSKELEQQLNILSKQDLLTGVYNRNYFLEKIDHLISRAVVGNAHGVLLWIVVDKFSELSEEVGITEADSLLVSIAELLKISIADNGFVARMEGPVFTILCSESKRENAEETATAIINRVHEKPITVGGKMHSASVSIGIAHINETVSNWQDVTKQAEKGAALAARQGGDQYAIYNPSADELEEKEQITHWQYRIKEALRNNQFTLLYQPTVSLHGIPGAHYEVLVRMIDESGNEIMPNEFLPAAEHADLTRYIDRWVITHTFKKLAERTREGEETHFFIKISPGSITDPEFMSWITERIKAIRLNTNNLIFMFNEEDALNHLAQTSALIEGFSNLNCRTGLENFGMEQNRTQSIQQLNVNFIKIHSGLIGNLAQNIENQEHVKEIAGEARARNIQTIAAFVEDANSLAVLWQCSVDFIQGYFLQPPEREMNYEFESAF